MIENAFFFHRNKEMKRDQLMRNLNNNIPAGLEKL
jgi:hypothetical protein